MRGSRLRTLTAVDQSHRGHTAPAASAIRGLVFGLLLLAAAGAAIAGGKEGGVPMPLIARPKPQLDGRLSFEAALARRRSVRAFAPQPLTRAQLGQILWAAQGIK